MASIPNKVPGPDQYATQKGLTRASMMMQLC